VFKAFGVQSGSKPSVFEMVQRLKVGSWQKAVGKLSEERKQGVKSVEMKTAER